MPMKGFMWAMLTLVCLALALAAAVVVATVRLAHRGGM